MRVKDQEFFGNLYPILTEEGRSQLSKVFQINNEVGIAIAKNKFADIVDILINGQSLRKDLLTQITDDKLRRDYEKIIHNFQIMKKTSEDSEVCKVLELLFEGAVNILK